MFPKQQAFPARMVAVAAALSLMAAVLVWKSPGGESKASGKNASGTRALLSSQAVPTNPHMFPSFGSVPLSFEQNEGQSDSRVKFLARGAGYTVFLTSEEAVLALKRSAGQGSAGAAALHLKLEEGNLHPGAVGDEPLPGRVSYLFGGDRKKWHANLPTFGAVRYSSVYPGVDMTFHGNRRELEYDFSVAPGADPRQIALRIAGADSLHLDNAGDAVLATSAGPVRFRRPILYQTVAGKKHSIDGGYVLRADGALGFHLGPYDVHKLLVIDPVVTYATYLGGAGTDQVNAMVVIPSTGVVYMTGSTDSVNFPTTTGSFLSTNPNGGTGSTAFVSEIDATGQTILFSTYLGGSCPPAPSCFEFSNALAVDANGLVYVAGQTASSDFPVTGNAVQTALPGDTAGFVSVLNNIGSALVYSTYLGGSLGTSIKALTIDGNADAFVTGQTTSVDFPVTSSAFQSTALSPVADPFVSEISTTAAAGASLVYSSYFGGSATGGINGVPGMADAGNGISLDANSNIYLTGVAFSADFPVTNPAFQSTLNGVSDAFFSELSTTSGLLYSTYLGGSDADNGTAIALDLSGGIYLTGFTSSLDFPVTSGVFQKTLAGGSGSDTFVAKVTTAPGSNFLVYSTYLGGSNGDFPGGIVVDSSGNAYIAGQTFSVDFPIFNPIQANNQNTFGTGNSFVSVLNPTASALLFSSYLGGGGTAMAGDGANAIGLDSMADIYVSGFTNSGNFPVLNPIQETSGGGQDGFLAKIGQQVSVTPSALIFSVAAVGDTTPSKTVTIVNNTNAPFTLTATVTGPNSADFAQTSNTCTGTVQILASCTLGYDFTSTSTSTETATLNLSTSIGIIPAPVPLSGFTGQAVATFSPASLTFASQVLFTSSAPQVVTLTNTGAQALNSIAITVTGADLNDFTQTNTCGSSLAVNASCAINVTFTPTVVGARTASLTVTDSAPDSPQSVPLTGTGAPFAPAVTLSPTSLKFPSLPLGSTSSVQTVTLTNSGSATLTLDTVAVTGTNASDFIAANKCAGTIPAGSSCSINVTFKPTALGARAASLTLTDNATNSPQTVPLTGTGVATGAAVLLSPASLAFSTVVNTTSSQTVTITNDGNAALTINSISITGTSSSAFTESNSCTSINAGGNCIVTVRFAPVATGAQSASLTISDTASDSPQNAPLTGQGTDFSAPVNSPSSLTLTAGQTGTFTATVSPLDGLTTIVSFSCTGAPQGAACAPAATMLNPDGTQSSLVTVTTMARGALPLRFDGPPPRPLLLLSFGLLLALAALRAVSLNCLAGRFGRFATPLALGLVLISFGLLSACGGSGGGSSAGTPTGTYTLAVVGSVGSQTHSSNVTLVVQ
jgi:hypothetical protein